MICQIAIFMLTGLAIWLITMKNPTARMIGGCIGLIGQGFWLYETFVNHQWGMFILSAWFMFIYAKSIYVGLKDRRTV